MIVLRSQSGGSTLQVRSSWHREANSVRPCGNLKPVSQEMFTSVSTRVRSVLSVALAITGRGGQDTAVQDVDSFSMLIIAELLILKVNIKMKCSVG